MQNTSITAQEWQIKTGKLMRDKKLIFNYIYKYGNKTCDEIEQEVGLSHQTASARIHDLFIDGLLKITGEKRKTRTGHDANVYDVNLPIVQKDLFEEKI